MGWGTRCKSGFDIRRVRPNEILHHISVAEESEKVVLGQLRALAAYSPASLEDLKKVQEELDSALEEYADVIGELTLLYIAKDAEPGELEEM